MKGIFNALNFFQVSEVSQNLASVAIADDDASAEANEQVGVLTFQRCFFESYLMSGFIILWKLITPD